MVVELATLKISKSLVDLVKDIERDSKCPIKTNDSLFIAVAIHELLEDFRLSSNPKLLRNRILESVKTLIRKGHIDKNARGYEKE